MLTVVLATHNGAETLPRVLDAYVASDAPPDGWRLVVVDNASTDATPAILQRYVDRLPIKRLHESRRGKNRALNAALPYLQGKLIVLTDDDAIPAPDFLTRWSAAPGRQPGYAMFGGAVRPAWPGPTPSWLISSMVEMTAAFSITSPTQPEGPIAPEMIFGPNMAVRAELFRDGLRFDEDVGPSGMSYAMGSETSFTMRLAQLGHRACFLPEVTVEHIIRPRQLSRPWLRQRALNFGRGLYLHERMQHQGDADRLWFGVPRWLVRQRLERGSHHHLALVTSVLSRDPERIVSAEWQAHVARGWWSELIRRSWAARRRP